MIPIAAATAAIFRRAPAGATSSAGSTASKRPLLGADREAQSDRCKHRPPTSGADDGQQRECAAEYLLGVPPCAPRRSVIGLITTSTPNTIASSLDRPRAWISPCQPATDDQRGDEANERAKLIAEEEVAAKRVGERNERRAEQQREASHYRVEIDETAYRSVREGLDGGRRVLHGRGSA